MKTLLITLGMLAATLSISQNMIHGVPYIEVTGEGQMEVLPDEIHLHITLSEWDSRKLTLMEWENLMREKLIGLQVDPASQLRVIDMSGSYAHWGKNRQRKEYELILNEPGHVPEVFQALSDIGIARVSVAKITHSHLAELEQQVKVAAVKSAKQKASGMLGELDQEVGRTLKVEEKSKYLPSDYLNSNGYYTYREYLSASGAVSRSMEEPTPLDFRKILLEYQVLVRFEIL